MKKKICFGLVLALTITTCSLSTPALAAEVQNDAAPISAIERASGSFNTTISAGKYKKIGSAISLRAGESVNFDANYSPSNASVDFGLLDSDNVFHYINSTTGSVNGGVEAPENGSYTPAIRNNSTKTISVTGVIEC